jgi:hypothetical protein
VGIGGDSGVAKGARKTARIAGKTNAFLSIVSAVVSSFCSDQDQN